MTSEILLCQLHLGSRPNQLSMMQLLTPPIRLPLFIAFLGSLSSVQLTLAQSPTEPPYSNSSSAEAIRGIADVSTEIETAADRADRQLEQLMSMESRLKRMLPKLLECVVSVDGGTGVIVSQQGVILTASHVTKRSGRTVKVRFSDGRELAATTLGTNFNHDTAAVQLKDAGPWPYLKIADSTLINPGDWCVAMGYPLSFPRGKPAAVRMGRILQVSPNEFVTDCPIMGGDSGGPLLNMNGNLIGISSKVKNGITENLHIPIQVFLEDWKSLSASVDIKKVTGPEKKRAYLGVLGETDVDRVRIRQVHSHSPAESAGLLADDVILELDGQPIGKFDDVLEILATHRPGELVLAKLNRFGRLISIPIKLGRRQ
jgi:serine protease Do